MIIATALLYRTNFGVDIDLLTPVLMYVSVKYTFHQAVIWAFCISLFFSVFIPEVNFIYLCFIWIVISRLIKIYYKKIDWTNIPFQALVTMFFSLSWWLLIPIGMLMSKRIAAPLTLNVLLMRPLTAALFFIIIMFFVSFDKKSEVIDFNV